MNHLESSDWRTWATKLILSNIINVGKIPVEDPVGEALPRILVG